MLEQIILYGLISGLIYSLLALGFTLIYGVSGIINLTHGAFYAIGAYIFGSLLSLFPSIIPSQYSYMIPYLALIVAPIITGIIGSIFYRLTLHQIIGDEIAILVVSVCGCIIFQQIIFMVYGPLFAMRFPIPTLLPGTSTIWNVIIVHARALAAILSAILFASLWIFIAKTKTGKAMKALSQDLEAAMLMGISVEKMYMLTSAISAGIASIAAILFTSSTTGGATAYMWLEALALSFSIVVLGGLGSIKGTLIGGFIVGYAEIIIATTIPNSGMIISSFPFMVMIIVLIIRPKGLFGKRIEME
jgi:branched-chain amino acid transport system permease protein